MLVELGRWVGGVESGEVLGGGEGTDWDQLGCLHSLNELPKGAGMRERECVWHGEGRVLAGWFSGILETGKRGTCP